MGLFSSGVENIDEFFTGSKDLQRALRKTKGLVAGRIEEARENVSPLVDALEPAMTYLGEGSTIGGRDKHFQDIQDSDMFSNILSSARREGEQGLADVAIPSKS